MRPGIVEFTFTGPEFVAEVDPVVGNVVAHIVLFLRDTEHADLTFVPPGNDVEPESAVRDMIDRRDFLGGANRVNRRDVKRCKYTDTFGDRGESRCPGEGLEIAVVEVDLPSHTLPACDRNNRLDAERIGFLRDPFRFFPFDGQRVG